MGYSTAATAVETTGEAAATEAAATAATAAAETAATTAASEALAAGAVDASSVAGIAASGVANSALDSVGSGLFSTVASYLPSAQAVSMGLSGLNALSAIGQGNAQAGINRNAGQNVQNAQALKLQQNQLLLQQTLGQQAALYSVSGVDTDVGTPVLAAGVQAGNTAASDFAVNETAGELVANDNQNAAFAQLKGFASAAGIVGNEALALTKNGNIF